MPNDPSMQGPFGKSPNGNGNGPIQPNPPAPAPTPVGAPTPPQQELPAPAPLPAENGPKTSTQIAGIDVIKNPPAQTENINNGGHTLRRWKCTKCGTIIESFHEVEACSKCGAGAESLVDVD